MKKLSSKPILKRASEILDREFASPKDIAWAWVTLLQSQQEDSKGGDENHYSRTLEFENWILSLNLPGQQPKEGKPAINDGMVSPEAVKNSARMVFEWPHPYKPDTPKTTKKSESREIFKDSITKPILDAIKDAEGYGDRAVLMGILEAYAKEGKEPFVSVTEEGIEWKGANWSEGEKLHLLTLKSLNNRLANLKKKGLI